MSTVPEVAIARVPLRLSLGGGGTDLPFYSNKHGGSVMTGAISLSVTVVARLGAVDGHWRFHHDSTEMATRVADLKNAYMREALRIVDISEPCEVASLGPVPSGTGLGSSGAFAVGLLAALHALKGDYPSALEIAEEAFVLESDHLNRPVGRQDPYACALGGLQRIDIQTDGSVRAEPLSISATHKEDLQRQVQLYYSGVRRDSSSHLHLAPAEVESRMGDLMDTFQIGLESQMALESGDIKTFSTLIARHWAVKTKNSPGSHWRKLVMAAVDAGAAAGKVVGAGGGGFLMICSEPSKTSSVQSKLESLGLTRVPFRFVQEGLAVTTLPNKIREEPV